MEISTVVGAMILIIVFLFLGKILSFLGRIIFIGLVVFLIATFFFGISLNQLLDWVFDLILLAF